MNKFMKTMATGGIALSLALAAAPAMAAPEGFDTYMTDSEQVVDHSAWAGFLSTYVVQSDDGINRIKYAAVTKEDQQKLSAYIQGLAELNPTKLADDEAFAYWANLYNAITVQLIVENYPVKSIKDISSGLFNNGPWKREVVTVNGQKLSLDDIEHGILRPVFKDARVHYAVNCASIGCPNLMAEPLLGATLDAQLDAGAKAFINHPRGISVTKGKVFASNIYKWFQEDFGDSEKGVIEHALPYANEELKAALKARGKIDKYGYDWSLNEVK